MFIPDRTALIIAAELSDLMLEEDIEVKEPKALRSPVAMTVEKLPLVLKGKTFVCKVDNQALKATFDREGTSKHMLTTSIGNNYTAYRHWEIVASKWSV